MVHSAAGTSRRGPLAVKVPEITFLFWIIKLLTTAGGEATSDYLALHGYTLAAVVEIAIFVIAVIIQFSVRRYVAVAYWFLALAIAIFGTGVADAMHLIVGIPYGGTTALWACILAVIFVSGTAPRARCRSTASPPPAASCSTGPRCSPRSPSEQRSATSPPRCCISATWARRCCSSWLS